MPNNFFHTTLVFLLILLNISGCSTKKSVKGTTGATEISPFPAAHIPEKITEDNWKQVTRRIMDMDSNSLEFKKTREKIVEIILTKHKEAVSVNDDSSAWSLLTEGLRLFTIEEIISGNLPRQFDSMAQWAIQKFSPMGDESKVMVALIVLMNLHPESEEWKLRFETISRWLSEVRETADDEIEGLFDTISIYRSVVKIIPVPVVTKNLLELYEKRHKLFTQFLESPYSFGIPTGGEYIKYYFMSKSIENITYDIAWLFVKMGTPEEAVPTIEKYRGKRGFDTQILKILEQLQHNPQKAEAWLDLSKIFIESDIEEALECCRKGWKLNSTNYKFPFCIGEIYEKEKEFEVAEEYYNIALVLNEKDPLIFTRLIQLYTGWIDELMMNEENNDISSIIEKLEKTFVSFKNRWPEKNPPVQFVDIIKRKGKAEFYAGEIDSAIEHLNLIKGESNDLDSMFTLSTIFFYKKQFEKASLVLKEILESPRKSQTETKFIRMLVLKKLGDIDLKNNKKNESKANYKQALETANSLIPYISLDYIAELFEIKGELHHRLGENEEALSSFKTAISIDRNKGIYGRILSYLMSTRDLASMKEVYHLVYTDSSIEEKWKIYFTLWYIALEKYMREEPDPTALQVLSMSRGKEWVNKLAEYYAGKLSFDELISNAATNGQKVEAIFYRAFDLAAQGKNKEFIQLLKETVNSQLYAFYETIIAFEILTELTRNK